MNSLLCLKTELFISKKKRLYFFNKRPMSHIAHLRNQIKSINIFAMLMLIWRWKKGSPSFWKLNGPYLSNLVPSLVEIGLDNLEKKMKMFTDGQMDDKWSENLNRASISSGEQKNSNDHQIICRGNLGILDSW